MFRSKAGRRVDKSCGLNLDLLEESPSRKAVPKSIKNRTKIRLPFYSSKSKAKKRRGSETSLSSASIRNACKHIDPDGPAAEITIRDDEIKRLREEADHWKKSAADLEQVLQEERMVREKLFDENEELKKKDNDNRDLIMLQNKTILALEDTLKIGNDEIMNLKRSNEKSMKKIGKLAMEKIKFQRQKKKKMREMKETNEKKMKEITKLTQEKILLQRLNEQSKNEMREMKDINEKNMKENTKLTLETIQLQCRNEQRENAMREMKETNENNMKEITKLALEKAQLQRQNEQGKNEMIEMKESNENNMKEITKLTLEKIQLQCRNEQGETEVREMKDAKAVNITYKIGKAQEVYISSSNKRTINVVRNGSVGSGSSGESKVTTMTTSSTECLHALEISSTELKEEKVRATDQWAENSIKFPRAISPPSSETSEVDSNSQSNNVVQQTTVEPEAMILDDAEWNDVMNFNEHLEEVQFAHAQLDAIDEECKSTSPRIMPNVAVGELDAVGQTPLPEGDHGHAGHRRTINLGDVYIGFSTMEPNLTRLDAHGVPTEFSGLIQDILTCIDSLEKLHAFLDMIEVPAEVRFIISTDHQMLLATCVEYTRKWWQRSVSDPSGTAPHVIFYPALRKLLES